MLKKINEGGVASEDGFSIQIVNPDYLEYKQNGFSAEIALGMKGRTVYVYASNLKCWQKFVDSNLIDEKTKSEIIKNIKEAVKLLTGNFEIC